MLPKQQIPSSAESRYLFFTVDTDIPKRYQKRKQTKPPKPSKIEKKNP
jgi:hypothetical protein